LLPRPEPVIMVEFAFGLDGAVDVEAEGSNQHEGQNEGSRQEQSRGGLDEQEPLTPSELALLEEFRLSGFYDPWESSESTLAAPTTTEPPGGRLSSGSTTPSTATTITVPSAATTITIPSAATTVASNEDPEEADEREAGVAMVQVVGSSPENQLVLNADGELWTVNGNGPPPQSKTAESAIKNVGPTLGVEGQERGQHQVQPIVSDLESDF